MTGCELSIFYLVDEKNKEVFTYDTSENESIKRLPATLGIIGKVIASKEAMVIGNPKQNPDINLIVDMDTSL